MSATTSSAGRSVVTSPLRPAPGSLTMTLAPSRAMSSAMLRPSPRPAPVMIPALPSRFIQKPPVRTSICLRFFTLGQSKIDHDVVGDLLELGAQLIGRHSDGDDNDRLCGED